MHVWVVELAVDRYTGGWTDITAYCVLERDFAKKQFS